MKYIFAFLMLLGTSFAAENEAEMNIEGKTLVCSEGKVTGNQVQNILQSNNENQKVPAIENITIGAGVTGIQQKAFNLENKLTVSIAGREDFTQLMRLILRTADHKNVTKIIVTNSNLIKKESSQNNNNAQDNNNDQEIQEEDEPTSSNSPLGELVFEMGNDIQNYTCYYWGASYNSSKLTITFTRGDSIIEGEEEETDDNNNKDNTEEEIKNDNDNYIEEEEEIKDDNPNNKNA